MNDLLYDNNKQNKQNINSKEKLKEVTEIL